MFGGHLEEFGRKFGGNLEDVKRRLEGKNLVLKRGRPRARGRYGKILKPFSQLTIKVKQILENSKEEEKA